MLWHQLERPLYTGAKNKSIAEIPQQFHYFLKTSAVYQFTAFFPDPPTK